MSKDSKSTNCDEPRFNRFLNINLDQVGDVRIFCEELLDDYKKQNGRLKEAEAIIGQLTTEQPFEKCDERRINILKSQIIQLERQISVLYESLRQRTGLIQESTTTMEKCCNDLKRFVSENVGSREVLVDRKVIIETVERLNKSRNQLSQASHILDSRALGTPVMFNLGVHSLKNGSSTGGLISENQEVQNCLVSLLDLLVINEEGLRSNSGYDYLNFHCVETLTAEAQKKLYAIKCALETLKSPLVLTSTTTFCGINNNPDSLVLPLSKLEVQLNEAMNCLDKLSNELLLVALVLPHASTVKTTGSKTVHALGSQQTRKLPPPPRVNLSQTEFVTCENLYKVFAPYLKTSNVAGIKDVIHTLVEIVQLQINIAETKSISYANECKFYSSVHELQIKYQSDLLELIQKAFQTFNRDLKRELCDPLADVLEQYDRLKVKPTDENLKLFMSRFKQHSEQITKSTFAILRNDDSSGQSAILEFGDGFRTTVEKMTKARVSKLREEALKIEDLDNDLQRFLIYDNTFERTKFSNSDGPKSCRKSKPSDPFAKSQKLVSQNRSESGTQRSDASISSGDILNPRHPLPQISPTHGPKDHGLPVVRAKKKRPPKVQYPLPDMEF